MGGTARRREQPNHLRSFWPKADNFLTQSNVRAGQTEENDMPVIAGFDKLASVPEEQITDKIRRRVVSGTQGTMVYWRMKAGAHAGAHKHPHEQFVWMVKGTMDFRIGNASVPRTIVITALPAVSASSASRGPPRGAGTSPRPSARTPTRQHTSVRPERPDHENKDHERNACRAHRR